MKKLVKFLLIRFLNISTNIFYLFARIINILFTKLLQLFKINKLILDEKQNLNKKKNLFLLYLPKQSKGWILEKLYLDIISSAKNKNRELIFVFTIYEIFIYQSICKIKIHSLHQEYVKRLLIFGFNPKLISTTYTHTRLDKNCIEKLKKINYVLPVNNSEANLLIVGGIKKEKIIVFPQGYNPYIFHNNFIENNSELNRDIDVLYVSKFVKESENYHYFNRKNYVQAIEILNEMAERGKKVFILGKNWNKYQGFLSPKIIVKDTEYINYPGIYERSKILISTSLYEGGPVSWLEGMASGCYLISYPTGFAKDAYFPNIGNHLLPLNSKSELIIDFILKLLNNYIQLNNDQLYKRKKILFNARFEELYSVLVSIKFSSPISRTNWIENDIQKDIFIG